MKRNSIEKAIILSFIIICPFFQGMYFYHQVYLAGAFLLVVLTYYIIINKSIKFEKSINNVCILIGIILYFASTFYAVDKGMAVMGFLKVLVVYIFYLVMMQTNIDKRDYMNAISYSGTIISVIALSAFFIPYLQEMFVQKGRLGSFFQYPNTFAVFILISIIIMISKEKIQTYDYLAIMIMWTCFLLTFSRSMYIIGIGALLIVIIYDRKKIKHLVPFILLGTLLWYIIIISVDISYVFNRIEETSIKTSEWLTRLLYYKDSISIMKDHPFGTGHLGYYYIQRIYQTGASYYVKYIHSNVLQIVMDIGIVGFVLVGLYFMRNIFNRKLSFYNKLILFIIFGHGAVDFDFQFLVIGFCIVIIVFIDKDKMKTININRECSILIISIFLTSYIYMALSSYYAYAGENEKSLYMYPYNTEAKIDLAKYYKQMKPEKAYELADWVIENNQYAIDAYIIKRDIDYKNWELEKAYISAEKLINLNPLSITHLEKYSTILLDLANENLSNNSNDEALEQLEQIFEIPYRLNKLAKERLTDYNVKHIPRLYMSKKLTEIYDSAKKLYDKIINLT
ncbi:hypothetical protein SH1V18_10340 [Vallitalea longa]|uniref:O-antigen ligase-related domain-containing protein n=1 Tax=Vallitalea longa TaxID=2936439 RepID=A0A9W5YAT9_9FIRM|nr:O-antigen ligase family protein [Vallitalea longa]GKX28554.1 hypothetical protein SH1V18_10340 [Vallitalea longa]